MINPNLIRDDLQYVKASLQTRGNYSDILDQLSQLDKDWRQALNLFEQLKQKQKESLPKGKPTEDDRKQLSELSTNIKTAQATLQTLEHQLNELALQLPNITHPTTPIGNNESDNIEIKIVGDIPHLSFTPKSHDVLAHQLNIIDFERTAKIAGSRFATYIGLGAKLERALISFMLDTHVTNGYIEYLPPALVNSTSLTGTGQLPKFSDDQFKCLDSDLWLSPTAEVQLTNFYQNEVLNHDKLPIKMVAFSPCFRKEAGSYGKDLKGLIRLHQFNKVELVHLVCPEDSDAAFQSLVSDAASILDQLKLPYRIVHLCSGDLGFSSSLTYDLEVWLPSQKMYREISSCSNFLDFQSRRAMIRYKCKQTKKNRYVHTLNGSGLAIGRTVAAIIENYQNADGSVRVPDVLVPYMNQEVISDNKI